MRVAVWAGNAFRTLYSTLQSQCHPQHRLAGSLDPAFLKTRAQYKSDNHLTGGSAGHTVDKRGSDAKLVFLGEPGFMLFPMQTPRGWLPSCTLRPAP